MSSMMAVTRLTEAAISRLATRSRRSAAGDREVDRDRPRSERDGPPCVRTMRATVGRPRPAALRLDREERLEGLPALVGRHPDARVRHLEHELSAGRCAVGDRAWAFTVRSRRQPRFGIASRALSARFKVTCSIWSGRLARTRARIQIELDLRRRGRRPFQEVGGACHDRIDVDDHGEATAPRR